MHTITQLPEQRDAALTEAELRAELGELPGWRGDLTRIWRTVAPGNLWGLLERVAATEADLDHHTVVDLDAGTVTFAVWTHATGTVTEADLELARRINTLLDD